MATDSVEREILIGASPEVVWRTITEPEQISRWFSDEADVEGRIGADGTLTWRPGGRGGGREVEMIVPIRVVDAEPFRRFSFRWNHPDGTEPDESNSALVEFTLVEEAGGTRLTVARERHRRRDRRRGQASLRRTARTRLAEAPRRTARLRSRDAAPGGAVTAVALAEDDALWSAVADPTRRRVLDALLERGEATTTALAEGLPVTRQAVAKHLAVLDRVGLVTGQRRGREVRYAVQPQRLDDATEAIARVAAQWDRRLARIKRLAEAVQAEAESTPDTTRRTR